MPDTEFLGPLGLSTEGMMDGTMVWALALVTLMAAVAIAVWQRKSISKAKDEHHHSALTQGVPGQRASDGKDPGTQPH